MRGGAILVLLGLAACAPRITAAGPNSVTVDHDTVASTRAEVQAKADEYCSRSGLVAREINHEPNFFTRPSTSFECVKAAE